MYNLTHPIKDTVWAKLRVTLRKEIPVTCVTPAPVRHHGVITGAAQAGSNPEALVIQR